MIDLIQHHILIQHIVPETIAHVDVDPRIIADQRIGVNLRHIHLHSLQGEPGELCLRQIGVHILPQQPDHLRHLDQVFRLKYL